MSRLLFSLAMSLLCGVGAFAQNVTGRIIDRDSLPVAGVAVILQTTDSLFIAAEASDLDGRFAIATSVRPYRLLLQHLSYEPLVVERSTDDAGTIVLAEAAVSVGEVVVRGERPLVKVEEGRLNYDLKQIVQGHVVSNAYEALTKLPGVMEQDGALTLAGTSGVTVLLNGRPSTMSAEQLATLLKSTAVDQVERVEVMYAAPPHYHVRGAVINVVLRRRTDESLTGQLHATYEGGYYNSWCAGGNLAGSTPKFSFDAMYDLVRMRSMREPLTTTRHTVDGQLYEITQNQSMASDNLTHNMRVGGSWTPTEKSRLDIAYTGSFTPSGRGDLTAEGNYVESRSRIDDDQAMHNLSLAAQTGFGLSAGADYTHYRTTSRQAMSVEPVDGTPSEFVIDAGQRIDRLSLYLDQQSDLGHSWKLNGGARFSYIHDDDYQYYLSDAMSDDLDTDFRLGEYTYDLYLGTSKSFSERLSFSVSLTGEYYRRNDYDRWALFPQASLNWMPSSNHILQAELSSDKSYPSFWEMSGATTYLDGYAEVHGTPTLRPSSSYSLTLTYIFRQKYIFQLYGNHRIDAFNQSAYLAPDRLAVIYQTLNWDYMSSYGALVVVPFRIGERFSSRLTLTAFDYLIRNSDFYGMDYKRSKWVALAAMENTLRLSRKPDLVFEFGGHYQSEALQCTYDIGPSWRVDAGMKWTFAGGKADLSVKGNDLFDSLTPTSSVNFGAQQLHMGNEFHTRNVTVNFVYRFGGYREKERKEVDTSRFGH